MSTNKGTLTLGGGRSRKPRVKKMPEWLDNPTKKYGYSSTDSNTPQQDRSRSLSSGSGVNSGFFGEDDKELSQMGWHSDSVIETFNSTTPEQIAASRISGGGPSAIQSFISNAAEAKKLLASGISPISLQHSNIPSEKLAYMANYAGLDIGKVSREVAAGANRSWPSSEMNNPDNDKDSDTPEQDFNKALTQAQINGTEYREKGFNRSVKGETIGGIDQPSIKSPTDYMLSTFGAMTISKDIGKQQVGAPDSISMGLQEKYDKKVANSTRALANLADLYLPKGSGRGLQNEVITALGQILPQSISNVGFNMAGNPDAQIPWSSALPMANQLAVSKSTLSIMNNPTVNYANRPGINASIKNVKHLFNTSNEGGLSRKRSTDYFAAKYMADELAAGGMDVRHTVLSQNSSRDHMYEFRVTTDIREQMKQGMELLGMNSEDMRDPKKVKLLKETIESGLDSDKAIVASAKASTNARTNVAHTMEEQMAASQMAHRSFVAAREQEKIMTQSALNSEMVAKPDSQQSNRLLTLSEKLDAAINSPVSRINSINSMFGRDVDGKYRTPLTPIENSSIQSLTGNMPPSGGPNPHSRPPRVGGGTKNTPSIGREGTSLLSPADALAKYQKNNPHMTGFVGDGKNAYGEVDEGQHALWQAARKGKLSSSIAAGMAGELSADTDKAISKVIRSGLGIKEKDFDGNSFTESGNKLEPLALDWYRRTRDSSTFETGHMENRNMPGQSTTPDAMADGGRRAVEVKSRDSLMDPNNLKDSELKAFRKYNMQMQHQMYITDNASADLVQVRRGSGNKNQLFNMTGNDKENFRSDTVSRDQELIGRMSPVWNRVGANAEKIAGLGKKEQDALAKAVETGNIKSFEKLSAKHGLDDAVVGGALTKAGGGGGGSGGDGKDLIDTIGAQHGPTSFTGVAKTALSRTRTGRGLNVASIIAGIAWDGAKSLNDTNLNTAFQAKSSGMSEDMWIGQRKRLAGSGYQTGAQAAQDIKSLGLATGGMSLGFTEGAERIVGGTRGLINFNDLGTYEGDAAGLMAKFKEKAAIRFGTGEDALRKTAAMAEQSGLNGLVATEQNDDDLKNMNEAFLRMDSNLKKLAKSAGEGFGDSIASIADSAAWLVGLFGGDVGGDGPETVLSNTSSGKLSARLNGISDADITKYKNMSQEASKLTEQENKAKNAEVTIKLTSEAKRLFLLDNDGRANSTEAYGNNNGW